jgi:hypothetical protein
VFQVRLVIQIILISIGVAERERVGRGVAGSESDESFFSSIVLFSGGVRRHRIAVKEKDG